jgi:HAE1 family hydrophobic/amphiphilic exporter-1
MQIRGLTVGQSVTTLRVDGEPLNVIVRANPAAVGTVEALRNLTVGSFGETPIPLSSVAQITDREAPAQIVHTAQKPSASVTGRITAKNTGEVNAKIRERVAEVPLPQGVEVVYGGAQEMMAESFNTLFIGIAAGVVIVYIVMVLVMGSLLSPFVIMFTLPLASIGAFAALALTGRALSMSSLFGVLMLVGIVVTNGIVLIDFVNQLRDRGMSVYDSLMEGGRLRLRPVLMTAVTTIIAMIPIALGFTEGAIMAAELATVVIGGLFSSTLLTLVVVPVVYSLFESLRERLTSRPASETIEETAPIEA